MPCELCDSVGGVLLWRDEHLRVVRVDDADYPMLCRVIWNTHVKEMTDLEYAQRQYFMRVVFVVEQVLRNLLKPAKMNLASLGNQTPHLHWHVIARFIDDRHFPQPVWAAPLRLRQERPELRVADEVLQHALVRSLSDLKEIGCKNT